MLRTAIRVIALTVCIISIAAAAEREWQTGEWREVTVERPRVSIGVVTRDPNNRTPQAASAREVRKYVIETGTHRLELRQDATADTPRVDAEIGEAVTFAIEKKNVYVRDGEGREHRLTLSKQTPLPK